MRHLALFLKRFHQRRVYLVDDEEAIDTKVISFSSRIIEVYVPQAKTIPEGVSLKAAIWYEVNDD